MSIESAAPTRPRWKKRGAALAVSALAVAAFAAEAGPGGVGASSHREAPLIAGDPRADNTDVYAFVSPDAPDSVTFIANWIPFEEPNGGPNFYTWADGARYNIKIDNDGDALADLTYTWIFDTVVRDPNEQFLSNTGPVTSLDDPDLNVYQTYDLTVTVEGAGTIALLGNGDGVSSPGDPISAPSIAGAASMPDYTPLRDQAIYPLPTGGKTYSGQADDPFFLDLRVFDLLYGGDASEVGQDTLAGYNVNSIALQVPKSAVAINGNAAANPVIGVWSTTDRPDASSPGDYVQVSRLGSPLVNEVVVPLSLKDAFNSISPDVDATVTPVVQKVLDPILPGLVEAIYGVPAPAPDRNDLFEIFLTGISQANAGPTGDPAVVLPVDLNSQDLNADASAARGGAPFRPSEMLRLNMAVAPTVSPNRYGVLAGDVAGFPNGRRLTDDIVDIEIQAVEGAALTGQLVPGLLTIDSVDRNDREFGTTFPYLALPHVDGVNNGVERSPRAPEIVPLEPERLLDTRSGIGYTGPKPTAGQTITLQVTGVGASMIPDDASTVFLNITATNSAASGWVAAYPCGSPQPIASNINPIPGVDTSGLVAAKVGAGGTVCITTFEETDIIADVVGYHPAMAAYVPVQPERLLDTRTGVTPADGATIVLDVTGVGTAQVPANAKAVFLNVTSTNSAEPGFFTVYPCGEPRPLASNVNPLVGVSRANLVAAKIAADGTVCIYTLKSSDIVVDLQGYVPFASTYVPATPERVLDTRAGQQVSYSGAKPIAGQTIEVKVTGFGSTAVPLGSGAVLLNVTATEGDPGFVTVYPCGSPRPLASNLNPTTDSTPNLVLAKIGDGGRVCIYTFAATHLVADINGYFVSGTN